MRLWSGHLVGWLQGSGLSRPQGVRNSTPGLVLDSQATWTSASSPINKHKEARPLSAIVLQMPLYVNMFQSYVSGMVTLWYRHRILRSCETTEIQLNSKHYSKLALQERCLSVYRRYIRPWQMPANTSPLRHACLGLHVYYTSWPESRILIKSLFRKGLRGTPVSKWQQEIKEEDWGAWGSGEGKENCTFTC